MPVDIHTVIVRSLETSSVVTQVKDEKLGGVNGGGK